MSNPKIADRKPIKVELKKGEEQYWCACGLSKNQPYCDGSHRTTDITPVKFEAEESSHLSNYIQIIDSPDQFIDILKSNSKMIIS